MLNKVTFSQVDSTDEIAREFNRLVDNCNIMESKICQLGAEVEKKADRNWVQNLFPPKPKKEPKKPKKESKKKGSVQMKTVGALVLLVLAFVGLCSVSFAQYRPMDINYDVASNPDLLSRYLRDVIGTTMAGDSYLFNPRAAAPTAALGRIYYDSGTNEWIGYNGAWTTFDVAAGAGLNATYGVGTTITANSGTVGITTTDADAWPAVTVTHSGASAAGHGIEVLVSNAAKDAIKITNTGTGPDIRGTAGFTLSRTGDVVADTLDLTGATGITLENDETITNADGDIVFTDSGTATVFVIDLDAGGNVVAFKSTSGVDTIDFDSVDDLSGVGNITFDAASAAITLTGGAGNDLTITQAGAADASVVIHSAGTELDAIKIHTDGDGGIDIDADEDIAITVTSNAAGEDLLLTQSGAQNAGIVLTSDGTGDIAIKLETTAAGGDIWLDSGDDLVIDVAGKYDFDLVGEYELDVAAGINITSSEAADGAITIATSDAAGNIIVTSTDNTADALDINTTAGGIDIDSASTIAIDNAAGNISINSAAGTVDIDAALVVTIDNAAGDISIDSAAGSVNITGSESDADAIKIVADGANGGLNIDLKAGGLDVDAVLGPIDLDTTKNAAKSIALTTHSAGTADTIVLTNTPGTSASAIHLLATVGGVNIDAAADKKVDIDAGYIELESLADAAGAISLKTNVNTAETITVLNAKGTDVASISVDSTVGGIKVDAELVIAIANAAVGSDITVNSAGGSVYIKGDQSDAQAIWLDANAGANGGVDIDTAIGGLDVDAVLGPIDLDTTYAGAGAIALTAHSAGATDTIVITNTPGTDVAAIALVATAGGVEIDASAGKILALDGGTVTIDSKTAGAGAIALTSATGATDTITILNSAGTAVATDAMAIQLTASAGSIGLKSATSTAVTDDAAAITLLAENGGISLLSEANVTPAVQLKADGGIAETILIQAVQSTENASISLISTAGGVNVDSTLVLNIQGDLAAASAIIINASAGGMDIDANGDNMNITLTSDAAGEDLTLKQDGAADGQIILDSVGTALDSIYLYEHSAGVGGGILIHSGAGTGVSVADATTSSIQLVSDAGGISIQSGINANDAIRIETLGGVDDTLEIHASTGTGIDSIDLISDLGGISIIATALDSTGAITISGGTNGGIDMDAAEDISITLAAEAGEDILISTTNTIDNHITITTAGSSEDAFSVTTSQGNIDLIGQGATGEDFDIESTNSALNLSSGEAQADAIDIQATAGGIDIGSIVAFDTDIVGGQVLIASLDDAGSAIRLFTNVGVSETIVITNTLGEDDAALNIDTTAGGVAVDAAKSIVLTSSEAQSDAIQIEASNASGGIVMTTGVATGVLINTASFEHKVKYFPISQGVTSATEVIVGGGTGLTCIGLAAGANEIGSTEGFVSVDDETDYVLFSIPLPDDFVNVGGVGDLIISFDVDEQAGEPVDVVVKIYEYDGDLGNTTAIVSDEIDMADDGTRKWVTFATLTTGIGGVTGLDQGDHLIIELSSVAAGDDFDLYGIRMIYRCGLAATQ